MFSEIPVFCCQTHKGKKCIQWKQGVTPVGRKCVNQWRKRWIGSLMIALGTGVFLALLLPGCMFLVAVLLICGGACLLYKS